MTKILDRPVSILPDEPRRATSTPQDKTESAANEVWRSKLIAAYSAEVLTPDRRLWPSDMGVDEQRLALLDPFLPLVARAQRCFREKLETGPGAAFASQPFDRENVVDLFMARLAQELLRRVSRTLALELQVAGIEERLQGETPQERFRSFLESLSTRRGALRFFSLYPVLARQFVVLVEQWAEAGPELLERLAADWPRITASFPGTAETDSLVALGREAGDSHRHGRRVQVLTFQSGFRLVYKPRPMAVEVHFQELLEWINHRGDHPPFPLLQIFDRGDYGWVEHVAAGGCESCSEVERFYERQGAYLALLYALEATDFHGENLVAAGENPVLVDLESLFHPRLGEPLGHDPMAAKLLENSVLRVGLLPQRYKGASHEDLDVSGLGSAPGQLTPDALAYLEGIGTDRMRVERRRFELDETRNRPQLAGETATSLDHSSAIVRGFTALYRTLVRHRDELLADDGMLARFAGDEVRAVLRPTRSYARILQESFHPTLLADARRRGRHFDLLRSAVQQVPQLGRVLALEREDLEHGDIPLFTARVDSRHLTSCMGQRIDDFFAVSPLESVRRRLLDLGPADLARQRWIIEASLATLASGLQRESWPSSRSASMPGRTGANRRRLIEAACGVGDRLEELALEDGDAVSWICFAWEEKGQWGLSTLGMDLYGGLPGVALFLANLAAESGEERYLRLARRAVASLLRWLTDQDLTQLPVGAFSGLAGWIYTLDHVGNLWQEPELMDETARLVAALAPKIGHEREFDVIGGVAGCLAVLLSLRRGPIGRAAWPAALACGERLLALAEPTAQGIAWPGGTPDRPPLAGFAHGAGGVAWALARLSAASGETRFREAALEAIAYERSLFCEAAGNWADLRDRSELKDAGRDKYDSVAWCHGAAGIGLARLDTFALLDGEPARQEVEAALATTVAKGFGKNHSLCHGELGNLELIFEASRRWSEAKWQDAADHWKAAMLESIEAQGYLCGVPLGIRTPGLMTGLAGIGYGLLRLASPERVASVLLLEPPSSRRRHRRSDRPRSTGA